MLQNAINQSPGVEIYLLALMMTGAIYLATRRLSDKHPGQIYTIFYIMFVTATVVSFLFYYAFLHINELEKTALSKDRILGIIFDIFIETSTNITAELKLLEFILVIGILPQIASYLVAGIFGCGSPPKFVSKIVDFTILALIKFASVFSGIVLALAIARLLTENPVNVDRFLRTCCQSVILISASFVLMWLYYRAKDIVSEVISDPNMRKARYVHEILIRKTLQQRGNELDLSKH